MRFYVWAQAGKVADISLHAGDIVFHPAAIDEQRGAGNVRRQGGSG
jgi:hypothetical protein